MCETERVKREERRDFIRERILQRSHRELREEKRRNRREPTVLEYEGAGAAGAAEERDR